jgi:hypothetical protein
MRDPDTGPGIPGSGGIRKIRGPRKVRQTRRVSHYLLREEISRSHMDANHVSKERAENIPTHVLRQIRKEVEDG